MKSGFRNFDLQNSMISIKLSHFIPLTPFQKISRTFLSNSNSKFLIPNSVARFSLQYTNEELNIHTTYFWNTFVCNSALFDKLIKIIKIFQCNKPAAFVTGYGTSGIFSQENYDKEIFLQLLNLHH